MPPTKVGDPGVSAKGHAVAGPLGLGSTSSATQRSDLGVRGQGRPNPVGVNGEDRCPSPQGANDHVARHRESACTDDPWQPSVLPKTWSPAPSAGGG